MKYKFSGKNDQQEGIQQRLCSMEGPCHDKQPIEHQVYRRPTHHPNGKLGNCAEGET